MTIAEQIKTQCRDAADAMQHAEKIYAGIDQDWNNETTTYTFRDGSRLAINGPTFMTRAAIASATGKES